jgi:hypothetical protein
MKHTICWGLLGSAVGTVSGAACYVERTKVEHCAQQDGDAYCREKYGAEASFCSRGACDESEAHDGCGPVRPSSDACYSACGGGKSIEDDPDCEGVAEGSSSSETVATADVTSEPTGGPTTMGSMSASGSETDSTATTTTGGGACEESSECMDPLAPICGATMCVPCLADEECIAKGAGAPVCADDGRCVACTPSNIGACEGTTPVCGALNECEGCGFHEQCPASACDIATGACFEEGCVVEVDGDGGAEYEDIQDAIVDGCVVIVHELNGADVPYVEALDIDGLQVALLAAPGEQPIVLGTGGAPSLSVTGGAVAYVQGLTFSGNTMAEGVSVNGANLYLDRTEVIANSGGGLVLANNAIGRLRNCFVGGGAASDNPGVLAENSTFGAVYSTLVGYDDGFGDGAALRCTDSTATARNSVFVKTGSGPDLDCPELTATYSAAENALAGVGNTALGAVTASWFVSVTNDLHLNNPPGALLTTAQWQLGDPATDYDGDSRPSEPGAMDVAGADVP